MAVQNDNTVVTKGDLKNLYADKIAPYLGANMQMSIGAGDYYDSTERIVGVWFGKPLYQKAVVGTTPSSSNTVPTGLTNVDRCFIRCGYIMATQYHNIVSMGYYNSANDFCFADFANDGADFWIAHSGGRFSNQEFVIIVCYTKTTDAANSAATTVGCYDINRPDLWLENTEIYFGNGLYGYRATGTITATSGTRQYTSLYKTNATYLVSSGGMWNCGNSENDYYAVGGNDEYNTPISSAVRLRNNNGAGDIALLSSSAQNRTNAPYDIWVTYTK